LRAAAFLAGGCFEEPEEDFRLAMCLP